MYNIIIPRCLQYSGLFLAKIGWGRRDFNFRAGGGERERREDGEQHMIA